MKKFTLIVLAAGLAVTAACTASTKDALPEGSDKFPTSTTVAAGKTETTTAPKVTPTTQAEILASMKALMADKTADATAREYADYYVNRDKASPDMREMDIGLIRMSCSF